MPKVVLHGINGTRTLDIKRPSPRGNTEEIVVLSPATLQAVIRTMPRRWLNVDELVIQLKRIHGIPASHQTVEEALKYCELEKKGIGTDMEVRRHDDGECVQPRKAAFAAAKELLPRLKQANINSDTLWEWIIKNRNK